MDKIKELEEKLLIEIASHMYDCWEVREKIQEIRTIIRQTFKEVKNGNKK